MCFFWMKNNALKYKSKTGVELKDDILAKLLLLQYNNVYTMFISFGRKILFDDKYEH